MVPDLSSELWRLPGARQFLHRVAMDLRAGISQIVLLPPYGDPASFRAYLNDYLDRMCDLQVGHLDIKTTGCKPLFDWLREDYANSRITPSYLENLVESPEIPDVILIENLGYLPIDQRQAWLDDIARWANACKVTGSEHSLIVIETAPVVLSLDLPSLEVHLVFRLWTGIPSVVEARLLYRLTGQDVDARMQWREYLLASLAGNDVLLAEELWDAVLQTDEVIEDVLLIYGKNRGWSANQILPRIQDWHPKPPGLDLSMSPKEVGFILVGQGLTVYTPEYGEEIHSAALAILGRKSEILHRIWRAQAALMLPLVDDFRLRICTYMVTRYGEDWAVIDRKHLPSPLDFPDLDKYFSHLSPQSWEKRQWGKSIKQIKEIRDRLAHYHPVHCDFFFDLWREVNQVHSMLYKSG